MSISVGVAPPPIYPCNTTHWHRQSRTKKNLLPKIFYTELVRALNDVWANFWFNCCTKLCTTMYLSIERPCHFDFMLKSHFEIIKGPKIKVLWTSYFQASKYSRVLQSVGIGAETEQVINRFGPLQKNTPISWVSGCYPPLHFEGVFLEHSASF